MLVALVVLYGVLAGGVTARLLDARTPDRVALIEARDLKIAAGIKALDRGGPPLLGAAPSPVRLIPSVASRNPRLPGRYFPLAVGDDAGAVLYPELIGHATGDRVPTHILRTSFVVLFAITAALLPLMFLLAFDSLLAALAAPFLFWVVLRKLIPDDVYWVPAWVLLTAVPLLFAVHSRAVRRGALGRGGALALVGLALLGGLASTVRGRMGLPLLVGALGLVLLHERGLRRWIALAVPLVAAYACVGALTLPALRAERDRAIARPELSGQYINRHATWHSIYIGLGTTSNRYGIHYSDTAAYAEAQRLDPAAYPYSDAYEATLRRRVFQLVRDDPSFVFGALAHKTRRALADGLGPFKLAFVLLPLAFLLAGSRRRFLAQLALVVPALLLTLAAPVLVVPIAVYEVGFVAACALVWLLVLATLLAYVERAASAALRGTRRDPVPPGSRAEWTAVGAFSLAGLALVLALHFPQPAGTEAAALLAAPLRSTAHVGGRSVVDWPFATANAPWTWLAAATAPSSQGLHVTTTRVPGAYQAVSPSRRLPAGSYAVVLDGGVDEGQLELGALDRDRDAWLEQALFDSHARFGGSGRMTLAFHLARPTHVAVVLANSTLAAVTSRWTLRGAEIRALPETS